MDYCAHHQDHVAVENCELCERPSCALCLWCGSDGHRLREDHTWEMHSSGEEVLPPTDYVDAVQNSLIDRTEDQEAAVGPVAYKGNSQDVVALVSALLAVTALFSCCGSVYCLPIHRTYPGSGCLFECRQGE